MRTAAAAAAVGRAAAAGRCRPESSVRTESPVRPARLVLLTVVVCALLAGSAGCSGSGQGSGSGAHASGAAGRPFVSAGTARAVVAHYNKVNNTANRVRKKSLAATIETGSVLERTEATYAVYPTLPADQQRELAKPFRYTKVRTYVPDHGDWFAATARTNTSATPRLLVFRKEKHAGAGVHAWRLAALVGLEERLPLPAVGRRGAVATAGVRARSGTLAPAQLAAAFTDLYATGGRGPGARLDRGTRPARRALAIHRNRDEGLGHAGVTKSFAGAEPAHSAVFALRTRDGGVLAVAPAAHTVRIEARRKGVRVTPSSAEAVFDGSARARIIDEQSGQLAAALPRSGRPRVLGAAYALTGSR